jgi:hypothetical protein
VSIWEERRVFGSRGQSLREELLGKGHQSPKKEAKHSSPVNHQVRVLPVHETFLLWLFFTFRANSSVSCLLLLNVSLFVHLLSSLLCAGS